MMQWCVLNHWNVFVLFVMARACFIAILVVHWSKRGRSIKQWCICLFFNVVEQLNRELH